MIKEYRYKSEYEASSCFWGTEPSKYVRLLAKNLGFNLQGKSVLDLGAGEGKNTVFLASMGGIVIAVDISIIALSRFQLQPNYVESKNKIRTLVYNIQEISFPGNPFDVIIAYGVLHCLDSKQDIYNIIKSIKKWLKKAGYFVGCVFTNEIPPPACQSYLNITTFLDRGELKSIFNDWKIISYEDKVISEIHPTSKVVHSHSLSRILVEKI